MTSVILVYHKYLCKKSVTFITPRVSDVMGVIVLTSCLCLCVCYHSNGQTYRLEFWHGGQVEGYSLTLTPGHVHFAKWF